MEKFGDADASTEHRNVDINAQPPGIQSCSRPTTKPGRMPPKWKTGATMENAGGPEA